MGPASQALGGAGGRRPQTAPILHQRGGCGSRCILHCFALLCIALHCFALLCIALHCFALLPGGSFGQCHVSDGRSRRLQARRSATRGEISLSATWRGMFFEMRSRVNMPLVDKAIRCISVLASPRLQLAISQAPGYGSTFRC